jgi:hypothetical protein
MPITGPRSTRPTEYVPTPPRPRPLRPAPGFDGLARTIHGSRQQKKSKELSAWQTIRRPGPTHFPRSRLTPRSRGCRQRTRPLPPRNRTRGNSPAKKKGVRDWQPPYHIHQGGAILLVRAFFLTLHVLTPVDLLINGATFVWQLGFNFETSVVFSNNPLKWCSFRKTKRQYATPFQLIRAVRGPSTCRMIEQK